MRKHKKIFYVGGMISLIFIPIIFWIYAKPTYDNLNLRVIDLGLPYKAKKGEIPPENSIIPIKGYNYKIVNVPQNFDKETEKKYFEIIQNIQKENIDKTGIKFQFSNENTYNDLVKLINLMQKTNQEMFGLDTGKTNAFYLVHRKIERNDKDNFVLCGGVLGREYLDQNDYEFRNSNFIQKKIKYPSKEISFLIIGYLVLVYFSINRLIKFT